jgi:uncharacterized protein YdaU (DUF1376 family)
MKDRRRPWYRWCPGDFYTDPVVLAMTWEQRARYRQALDFSWMHSEHPGAACCDQWGVWMGYTTEEWETVQGVFIGAFEELNGDIWRQKRMWAEFEHATTKSRLASQAGKVRQSASIRSASGERPLADAIESRDVDVDLEESKEEPTLLSNGVGRERVLSRAKPRTKTHEESEWTDSFVLFWRDYPRREGKFEAQKSWEKVGDKTQDGFDLVMSGLHRYVNLTITREKKHILMPATWLNNKRWNDEIPEA